MTNDPAKSNPAPNTSAAVRAYLVDALNLDLVGPSANHELAEERIPGWVRPSNWYLTGFLVPADAPAEQSGDADEEDELDETHVQGGKLRFHDPETDEDLRTHVEDKARGDEQEARADVEKARADEEKARANAAEREVARLKLLIVDKGGEGAG